jgi:DNA invertase Pin-like site-specific DNA recombinase
MIYAYISACRPEECEQVKNEIRRYAADKNLELLDEHIVYESQRDHPKWETSRLFEIVKSANRGEEVIVYDACDVARTPTQMIEALNLFLETGVILHLAKYGQIFTAEKTVDIKQFLELMQHIQSEYQARMWTEPFMRRRNPDVPLGRPKGKLNKTLKLDKFRKEIQKYLDLNISKASIAKLIKCHPQTLYNYMDKRNMHSKKEEEEIMA